MGSLEKRQTASAFYTINGGFRRTIDPDPT
jgi:hypothetical protein